MLSFLPYAIIATLYILTSIGSSEPFLLISFVLRDLSFVVPIIYMTIVHDQTIKKQEQLASLRTMAYNSAGKSADKSNDDSAHSGGQILNGDTSYNFDEERSSGRGSFNPYEMEDGEGMWNSGNEWLRTSITEFDGYTLESTLQG